MLKNAICFLFALFAATGAVANPLGAIAPYDASSPIDISADSFVAQSNNCVKAIGNVFIRQGDAQITADSVTVNRDTAEVVAEGNVVLLREGQAATKSQRLVYNYATGEGLSPGLDVQSRSMRVISGEARRDTHGGYVLSDALVTTCTNDPSSLHYCVKARNAEFLPGQYVQMHGAQVRFLGAPVFYYPLFRRSLVDHFGWRFIPGYETDWGAYLLATYKTELVNLGGTHDDSVKSYTHFDYRTERGPALGEDITWSIGDRYNGGHAGMLSVYGIFDDNPMGSGLDRFAHRDEAKDSRYRISFRHDASFGKSGYFTARTSYFSDSYVFPDFYEDEYKDYIQPESYASYIHNGTLYSFGATVNQRANKFYENVNRLPEFWLDTSLLEFGQSGVYYESQSSGGFLRREFADYGKEEPLAEDYESLRIDSKHEFSAPLKLGGALSFVPRASYRATYYSDRPQAAGGADVAQEDSPGSGNLRNIFDLGFESSLKAYGFFRGAGGISYRHVVEPYLNWTYVPEPNLRPGDLYRFDYVDDLDMGNYMRLGVRQILQSKQNGSAVREILDLDLYAVYYFEDAEGESGVKAYGYDLEWRLAKDILVDSDALYDAEAGEFDHIDFWIALWQGQRWEAAGQCYYIPDDAMLLKGDVRCNFSERWAMGFYTRYDSEASRCESLACYLQYNLDCLSFRFRTEYEPAYTRLDGSEREAKLKFSFYAWLRAFTPTKYERKLRDRYWDD